MGGNNKPRVNYDKILFTNIFQAAVFLFCPVCYFGLIISSSLGVRKDAGVTFGTMD